MKYIKHIINEIFKSPEQQYLESSLDVFDLERRQLLLSRGEAPFQLRTKLFINTGGR